MESEEMLKVLVALRLKLLLQSEALSISQGFVVTGNMIVLGECYKGLTEGEHNRGTKAGT